MSAVTSILRVDWKGITRDQVLALNASASVAMAVVICVLGLLRGGDPAWARWLPPLLALSLLTGPLSWGFQFGLLMVDEKDSGVRGALAVTPVPPARMLLVRSLFSTGLMVVWPLVSLSAMSAAWRGVPLSLLQWAPLVTVLSLGAPLTALTVATAANNKVEAMALFKGLNFMALAPLALYLIPPEARWRWVFLALPSTWGLEAFEALRAGRPAVGWLAGAGAFHLALLGIALRAYTRALYKASL
jgi:fluoroquinolone transport system permease protein